jgi:hypothetical protein
VQDKVPLIDEGLEVILDGVRLASVILAASATVIRPCSRANSSNVTDNSGMSAKMMRSRSFFSSNPRKGGVEGRNRRSCLSSMASHSPGSRQTT